MYESSINAPRNHIKFLGYTLSRGTYDAIDCVWYEKGEITFDSPHIITGTFVTLLVGAIIVWVAAIILLIGPIGLLIDTVFMIWAMNIWFKLFIV